MSDRLPFCRTVRGVRGSAPEFGAYEGAGTRASEVVERLLMHLPLAGEQALLEGGTPSHVEEAPPALRY